MTEESLLKIANAIEKIYETYRKEFVGAKEAEQLTNVIEDSLDFAVSTYENYKRIIDKLEADIKELMEQLREKRKELKDVEEERKLQLVEQLLSGCEKQILGLKEGESISWKILNSTKRMVGAITAKLEAKEIPPDELTVFKKALDIYKKRAPRSAAKFEEIINELKVSNELLKKETELVVGITIRPESKDVLSYIRRLGLQSLLEQADLWEKVRLFWNKFVGFINELISDIFSLSKEVDDLTNDVEAIVREIE